MIGTLLDQRYQVVEVLGQGGFGHTYIAQDTRRPGNPTCVVKQLKPATSDPEFLKTARRLFNSEAETLEKLGAHDQIPRLLAYFEQDQEFYLVQEYIDGHPLNEELSSGQRWSEIQVIQMLREVLSILEFVHNNGVIHRDIKPENLIRRSSDNALVLVDFGAVKQVQMHSIMTQAPIEETVAIGTPGYMPSEQGQGRPRPSSDLYALGMIGIQALTGMNPRFLSEDAQTGEILWRQHAQVSDGLAVLLSKMARPYFKYRYQTATEALQALDSLTNPHSLKAWAALASRLGRSYLQNGYETASEAMRSLASVAKTCTSSSKTIPLLSSHAERTVTINPGTVGNSSSSRLNLHSLLGYASKVPHKMPLLAGAGTATLVIAIAGISAMRQPTPSAQNTQSQAEVKETKTAAVPSPSPENIPTSTQVKETKTAAVPSPSPKKTQALTEVKETKTESNKDKSDKSDKSNKSEKDKSQKTEKAQPTKDCIVVTSSSNLRSLSGRRQTGKVIESGTKVTTTGKEDDGWIEISAPEKGWIWKERTKNTCPPAKKPS